jgi:hypothetical protein
MEPITIPDHFKQTIAHVIEQSESSRADHILTTLVESGWVDDEFGHLIFAGDDEVSEYDVQVDLVVLDAIEDEVKRQLLVKYNEQN